MTEGYARKRSRVWIVARLLLVIVVFALLWRGVQMGYAYAGASPRFAVDADQVGFHSPSPWLTDQDLRSIRRDSGLAGCRISFFDPSLVPAFRAGYARSPWVEQVVAVHPRYPNRVDVVLRVREPVAGILIDDRDIYLLDERGRRLPGVRDRVPEGLGHRLLRIDGVAAKPPFPGDVWSDPVREGVSVALLLRGRPDLVRRASIHAVDVSNVGLRVDRTESEIVLVTAGGTRIEWGRSEISPWAANEVPVGHKLALLETALTAYPGLTGVDRLRVQFENLGAILARE